MDEKKNVKRDNFIRISESRVSKIIFLLEQMTNLNNTSFYEYTNDDIEKIFLTLTQELEKSKRMLIHSNKKNSRRFEL